MLAFFITWLIGYILIFLSFINVLIEIKLLNFKNIFYVFLISIFSWLIIIIYIILYLYEKLFKRYIC